MNVDIDADDHIADYDHPVGKKIVYDHPVGNTIVYADNLMT